MKEIRLVYKSGAYRVQATSMLQSLPPRRHLLVGSDSIEAKTATCIALASSRPTGTNTYQHIYQQGQHHAAILICSLLGEMSSLRRLMNHAKCSLLRVPPFPSSPIAIGSQVRGEDGFGFQLTIRLYRLMFQGTKVSVHSRSFQNCNLQGTSFEGGMSKWRVL